MGWLLWALERSRTPHLKKNLHKNLFKKFLTFSTITHASVQSTLNRERRALDFKYNFATKANDFIIIA